MVGVAGTPRSGRVVARDRSLLVAVQRLHSYIQIHDPGLFEQPRVERLETFLHPGRVGMLFRYFEQRAPHAVLAGDFLQAEQPRAESVPAQCRYVGVTVVAVENRQEDGAQNVTLGRSIVALVSQRAITHPLFEEAGGLKIVREIRQTTHRGSLLLVHLRPFDPHPFTRDLKADSRPAGPVLDICFGPAILAGERGDDFIFHKHYVQ